MAATAHAVEQTVKRRKPINWTPYAFMGIPLAIYFMWIIIPTFYTFFLSTTNWNGIDSNPEILTERLDDGTRVPDPLGNFERLFARPPKDAEAWGKLITGRNVVTGDVFVALRNNILWLLAFITVPTAFGLGLAMLLNGDMKGGRVYKIIFYAPLVLSGPVIGLIWAWVYHPADGLINTILRAAGVGDPPGWLGDRGLTANFAILVAAVWRQVGYVMILYLAGLKNIDPSLVDAALVDGASRWQLFRRVILPMLAPVTTIVMVISIIDSLRSFDLVRIMTNGGADTQVLANMMYVEMEKYDYGLAAAVAVVLFLLTLMPISIYLWRSVKTELEY